LVVPGDVPDLGEEDRGDGGADPRDTAEPGVGWEGPCDPHQLRCDRGDPRLHSGNARREIRQLERQGGREEAGLRGVQSLGGRAPGAASARRPCGRRARAEPLQGGREGGDAGRGGRRARGAERREERVAEAGLARGPVRPGVAEQPHEAAEGRDGCVRARVEEHVPPLQEVTEVVGILGITLAQVPSNVRRFRAAT